MTQSNPPSPYARRAFTIAAASLLITALVSPLPVESMQRRTPGDEQPLFEAPPTSGMVPGWESPEIWEAGFSERRDALLVQIADHYVPTDWSDRGKFSFPKALARMIDYGVEDEEANHFIAEYAEENRGFRFFHFPFVGMSRIMKDFPEAPALKRYREEFLHRILQDTSHYNALTAEGTENHVSMSRTSGYLFATEARGIEELAEIAADWDARIKAWCLDAARKIYEVGTAEWDSSVYTVYNMIGWINLYDHAEDPEIREAALAVLDYYAAAIALKYTQRVYGGPESRGTTDYTTRGTATEYLGWLWFGRLHEATQPGFWRGSEYIQSVYAALSNYRPPHPTVALARKQLPRPATYINTKPSYLLTRPAESIEVFHIGETYTLGSVFTPYGGWSNASYGTVNWKLVIEGPDKNPGIAWGNGGMKSQRHARGRNPFDQFVQHENVVVQMTGVPTDASRQQAKINKMVDQWKEDYRRDFVERWGDEEAHNPVHRSAQGDLAEATASYMFLPANALVFERDGVVFAAYGDTWLAVRSLARARPQRSGSTLRDTADAGTLLGLILEVGNLFAHGDFTAFQEAVLQRTALDRTHLDEGRFTYRNLAGQEIEIVFDPIGGWNEPEYDWSYGVTEQRVILTTPDWEQPDWPSGEGHGRLAHWSVDGVPVNFKDRRAVYDGPNVLLDGSILRISDGHSTHVVDYRERRPVFNPQPRSAPRRR